MKISRIISNIMRQATYLVFLLTLLSQNGYALNCHEIKELTYLYFKMHYSFNTFDAELSKRTLDNFLKAWDPGKQFFFKADIDDFEAKYASKLGEMIKSNDCTAIDTIVNVYSKRFEEREKYAYKLIDDKYDFTIDEYLIVDRKKMGYALTLEELNERWRKRVKFQLLELKSSVDSIQKAKEKLKKRYELVQKRHNEMTKDQVLSIFLNSFSSALDPHSSYLPADDLEDFKIRTRLSLEGIGATLRSEDGFTIVVAMVKGGAAQKGGLLKVNDKIIGVAQGDGESVDVIDMDLQEVVKKIRGPGGTFVKLTVMREVADKTIKLVIPIKREKIQLVDQQASSKLVNVVVKPKPGETGKYKVGVINLPSFYIDFDGRRDRIENFKSSSQDTINEIEKLKKQGVDGLIMDLRNNGGGSLDESVRVAGLFFNKGPVVQVKTQKGDVKSYDDEDGVTFYDGPLVVLINRHSASASEIFAGAIQDYARGIIVGDSHTFGKGTVQNLNDVSSRLGAIKVTVNKFYRASGASTQLNGVSSDVRLPSFVDEFEVGEKYYPYALPFETIKEVSHEKFGLTSPYVPTLQKINQQRTAANKEFKEIVDEIEKYKKNEEERSKVSLMEKKPDKAGKQDGKVKSTKRDPTEEEPDSLDLKDDIYLQECINITTDYIRLLHKEAPAPITIPALADAAKKAKKTSAKKGIKK
ncbi:MAG: carboxy terminal-processing peptidase [Oligoflexales bacterium]|nr:carboxy terminal-processing peptidase [Oligoflexales bacterium]